MTTLASTKLFGRSCTLVIGSPTDPSLNVQAEFNEFRPDARGLDVSGLDFEFEVDKSLKPTEFNTCTIKAYNLAEDSRQQLSGASKLSVKLDAGYVGGTSQLYFAEARSAWTTREGPDYVTHIESTDTIARVSGVRKTKKIQPGDQTGNIYRTTGARVPLQQAFQAIAAQLGIGVGNLNQALQLGGANLNAVNGSALLGNGAKRMTDLCRSAGLEWSIQDGNLQLLQVGQALSTEQAIEISSDPNTGLVESPSVDSQGAVSLTTLLIPGLAPGVLIKLDTLFVKGGYRIDKIRYVGNTRGEEWYAHIEAAKY